MTQQQWEAVERSLAGLTLEEKREVAVRLMESVRASSAVTVDVAERRRNALDRLRRRIDAIPAAENVDGLSNRDHDAILYSR